MAATWEADLKGLLRTALLRVPARGGDVLHAIKSGDPGFAGFGEAYLTIIEHGYRKGWKRHTRMVMNLVVVHGHVRFVVHDGDPTRSQIFDLSPDISGHHARLTVESGLWVAFEGMGEGHNVVLNVASIRHDPAEAESRPVEDFEEAWPVTPCAH